MAGDTESEEGAVGEQQSGRQRLRAERTGLWPLKLQLLILGLRGGFCTVY